MAPMRVLFGTDVAVEVETAEDAVRLLQLYKQSTLKPSPASPASVSVATPPGQLALRGVAPTVIIKSPDRVVFKNGHYAALEALYAAGDEGLDSEALVKHLGLTGAKSLPPTLAAWGKRAKSVGLDLRELLDVDRGYEHGKPKTIYKLTAKGREVFRPQRESAQISVNLGR